MPATPPTAGILAIPSISSISSATFYVFKWPLIILSCAAFVLSFGAYMLYSMSAWPQSVPTSPVAPVSKRPPPVKPRRRSSQISEGREGRDGRETTRERERESNANAHIPVTLITPITPISPVSPVSPVPSTGRYPQSPTDQGDGHHWQTERPLNGGYREAQQGNTGYREPQVYNGEKEKVQGTKSSRRSHGRRHEAA
jgi:hypothetical protein